MKVQAVALGAQAPELFLEVIKVALYAEDDAAGGCVIGRATLYASLLHGSRKTSLTSKELCEDHSGRRVATLPLQFCDLNGCR